MIKKNAIEPTRTVIQSANRSSGLKVWRTFSRTFLRRDPFERAEFNSNTYLDWMVDHIPQMYLMQAVVASALADFVKFPPRQKPASFNLDAVLAQLARPHT
jgi:hypothetical protein